MKKINIKQNAFLHLTAVIALPLIIFLSINVQKAECFSTDDAQAAVGCNATRISDCLSDDEEFLMESEATRRILQAGKPPKTITYPVLNPQRTHCNANDYSSCIGKDSKTYKKRPCNYQNHCGRKP